MADCYLVLCETAHGHRYWQVNYDPALEKDCVKWFLVEYPSGPTIEEGIKALASLRGVDLDDPASWWVDEKDIWGRVADRLGWEVPRDENGRVILDRKYAANLRGPDGYLARAYDENGVDGLHEFFMRPVWKAVGDRENMGLSRLLTDLGAPYEVRYLPSEEEQFVSDLLFC